MPDHSKQVWRRPRKTSANGPVSPADGDEAADAAKPSRHRRLYFPERLKSTADLLALGDDERQRIEETRHIVRVELDQIVDAAATKLLWHAETAPLFSDGSGIVNPSSIAACKRDLKVWLEYALEAPLQFEDLADHLALVAHEYVRPREPGSRRIKARLMLLLVSHLDAAIARALAGEDVGQRDFAARADAWHKLLFAHLDLLLAIYSATESKPHWY